MESVMQANTASLPAIMQLVILNKKSPTWPVLAISNKLCCWLRNSPKQLSLLSRTSGLSGTLLKLFYNKIATAFYLEDVTAECERSIEFLMRSFYTEKLNRRGREHNLHTPNVTQTH
jgi:hypothetical protein